jgi:branched-chain amino acid transport system ATP-binding protein
MNEILKVINVVKSFGGLKAVDGVSLTINKGELVGLIGPNGSGKTTLFNVVSGLYKPDEGEIYFLGERIDGLPSHKIFEKGLVRSFQNPRLFLGMSCLENMLIAPKNQIGEKARYAPFHRVWAPQELEYGEEAFELMRFLNLNQASKYLSSEISGGQMKLLELGRGLIAKPKLLLLDEPTAGVAPKLAREIFEKIIELKKSYDVTFFIIEHRLEMLFDYVEHVFVMHNGKIIASGSKEDVVNNPLVRKVYLGGEV